MIFAIIIWLILGITTTIFYWKEQESITIGDLVHSPILIILWPFIAGSLLSNRYQECKDQVLWRRK